MTAASTGGAAAVAGAAAAASGSLSDGDEPKNEEEDEEKVEEKEEEEAHSEHDEEEAKEDEEEHEEKSEKDEDSRPVSKAQSARTMRSLKSRSGSWVDNEIEILDGGDRVQVNLRGRPVTFRIPPKYRDDWDPRATEDKPDVDFSVEWVYGYRGRDSWDNLHNLPTGEVVYYIAAIAVLYNPEAQTQRHFDKHTNDIECLAVHPSDPLAATGQKPDVEGHPYVMVWNYDTLELFQVIGAHDDTFSNSISAVSFSSPDSDGESVLAVVDGDERPVLSLWKGPDEDGAPRMLNSAVATSDAVMSAHFLPESANTLVLTGKGQVSLWSFDKEDEEAELDKKQGLFTRKIPRPAAVNCAAFAKSGEILTGDTDGNVMIWGGVKVVRVLKGAHEGSVASICVMDDGSIVSGGLSDGAFVVFNEQYQLIGAGATLPENLGCVRTMQKRSFAVSEENGAVFYHMLVGTTSNSIVDVSFTVTPGRTEIEAAEFEVLVQGHSGELRDIKRIPDRFRFISGGDDHNVIMWDAVAHKAIWTGNAGSAVYAVAVAPDKSGFAFGLESGAVYHVALEPAVGEMAEVWAGDESVTAMEFSPESDKLAVATKDLKIYILEQEDSGFKQSSELEGHTAHVNHLDWSNDGKHLVTNSIDYEILYWDVGEASLLTDGDAIDAIEGWYSQNCTLTFQTIGVWPIRDSDGTDINACDNTDDVLAVGDDNGEVLLYKYPAVQPNAEFDTLAGHSAHVTGVAFLHETSLVSAGGRECSIIQWAARSADTSAGSVAESAKEDGEEEEGRGDGAGEEDPAEEPPPAKSISADDQDGGGEQAEGEQDS